MDKKNRRYFVVKVADIASLKKCITTGEWACRDRKCPPQPYSVLTEAYNNGQNRVMLVFSVNNCHGWHGFAEMLSLPGTVHRHARGNDDKCIKGNDDKLNASLGSDKACKNEMTSLNGVEEKDYTEFASEWQYFTVEWCIEFLSDFGERCLDFQKTVDLILTDHSPLNKSRNWKEIEDNSGRLLCERIEAQYKNLCEKRKKKEADKEKNRPLEFFTGSGEVHDIEENWKRISEKVEKELGKVLLACPFGSQRYNLHTPSSDMDMFIVYQADTSKVLGFNPPQHTVKNSEKEICDYTIHEVYRFCELLLSGDHRCVETLFLHPSTVYISSTEYSELRNHRDLFCKRNCLDKYLRDATGSKGTKLFDRWISELSPYGTYSEEVMPQKMNKLAYVIIRLLQNANFFSRTTEQILMTLGRDEELTPFFFSRTTEQILMTLGRDEELTPFNIVECGPLKIYRESGTEEYKVLMEIRNGRWSLNKTKSQIARLLESIEEKKDTVTNDTKEMKTFLERWMLTLRFNNFKQNWDP